MNGKEIMLPRTLVYASPRKNEKKRAILSVFPEILEENCCLDIGTSHGGLASFFSQKGRWTYVDLNEANLEAAKRLLKGEFVAKDAVAFLSCERKFRLITCLDTFMYFEDYHQLLSKIYDSLKEGGELIISGVNEPRKNFIFSLRCLLGLSDAHGFKHDISLAVMKEILQSQGFSLEREKLFFGPVVACMQTILDWMASRREIKMGGDRLTQDISGSIKSFKRKIYILKALGILNHLWWLID
jgi:SAM-dependent methyltransferase